MQNSKERKINGKKKKQSVDAIANNNNNGNNSNQKVLASFQMKFDRGDDLVEYSIKITTTKLDQK